MLLCLLCWVGQRSFAGFAVNKHCKGSLLTNLLIFACIFTIRTCLQYWASLQSSLLIIAGHHHCFAKSLSWMFSVIVIAIDLQNCDNLCLCNWTSGSFEQLSSWSNLGVVWVIVIVIKPWASLSNLIAIKSTNHLCDLHLNQSLGLFERWALGLNLSIACLISLQYIVKIVSVIGIVAIQLTMLRHCKYHCSQTSW